MYSRLAVAITVAGIAQGQPFLTQIATDHAGDRVLFVTSRPFSSGDASRYKIYEATTDQLTKVVEARQSRCTELLAFPVFLPFGNGSVLYHEERYCTLGRSTSHQREIRLAGVPWIEDFTPGVAYFSPEGKCALVVTSDRFRKVSMADGAESFLTFLEPGGLQGESSARPTRS